METRVRLGIQVGLVAGILCTAMAVCHLPGGEPKPGRYAHELISHESPEDFTRGTLRAARISHTPPGVVVECDSPDSRGTASYESPAIESRSRFSEALLSWNVDAPPGTGFWVEMRVGRRKEDSWSPYLYVDDWGTLEPPPEKTIRWEQGFIDVDYFRSETWLDRVQYRLQARGGRLRIARMDVTLSRRLEGPLRHPVGNPAEKAPPPCEWERRLPVPFRSQKVESSRLAGRICSPTSVAMMLEYRGVHRPTAKVAERAYDAAHDIYGNWPRAIQTAYSYGVPGHLARFADWDSVRALIARDHPLIISIKAGKGELTGAPYPSTAGHLLVLVGFDADGNVLVNDPAAHDATEGQCAYDRGEMERVWLARGGTAYVLLPRPDVGQ